MGITIYKRKDGRFESRLKIGEKTDGKPIYKYIYADSKSDCRRKAELWQLCLGDGKQTMRYDKVCKQWLDFVSNYAKKSTYGIYAYTLNRYLIPTFGKIRLCDLTEERILAFIDELMKKKTYRKKLLSNASIHNIFLIFKMTLKFAEKHFGIANPANNINLSLYRPPKNKELISDDDWIRLKRYVQNDYSTTATAIAIAVYTGMRIGEICALQRQDIDLMNDLLHVQRTVQRVNITNKTGAKKTKLALDEPKSLTSHRIIPIPTILLKHLRKLCRSLREEDFLFGRTKQKALEPRTLQYRFKDYLRKHHIPIVNFHQLRHKFAGNCIENNFDLKSLSEILGHSSVNITLNYYVHPTISFKRRQINNLS